MSCPPPEGDVTHTTIQTIQTIQRHIIRVGLRTNENDRRTKTKQKQPPAANQTRGTTSIDRFYLLPDSWSGTLLRSLPRPTSLRQPLFSLQPPPPTPHPLERHLYHGRLALPAQFRLILVRNTSGTERDQITEMGELTTCLLQYYYTDVNHKQRTSRLACRGTKVTAGRSLLRP